MKPLAVKSMRALVLLIGVSASVAPLARPRLPEVVQAELADMAKACRDVGGRPMESRGLLIVADFTGDGLPDFVIDQGVFVCKGAAPLFAGSGGSQMSVFVGTADGQAFKAFASGSFGVEVDRADKPARLRIAVGGPLCGERVTPETPRSEYRTCWRPVRWSAAKREMEFSPLAEVEFQR